MNVVRELVTKLRYQVDNSKLKAYMTETQTGARNLREKFRAAFSGVRSDTQQMALDFDKAKKKFFSLRNMVAGYFAMAAGGSMMKVADDWASVDARVKLATKSAQDHKHALEEIFALSQRSGQDYLASADLFSKVSRSADDLGLGLDDTLNLTEIIGQTMTIGGGDKGAQEAALMQLGQALGSGALRGDELNSIIEQAPRLAQAIADSFNVPVGQLKDLGKAGKLTSKELAQGLLKQADKIKKEFDLMPKTFGRGMVILRNEFNRLVSYAINKVGKLGEAFYNAAEWIVNNIRLVGILALSAIGGKLMLSLRGVKISLQQITLQAIRAAAPFLAISALLAGIGLILEDIYVWQAGGISVMGALVGRYDKWAVQFQGIKQSAKLLWANVKGILRELARWANIDIDFDSWQGFATTTLQYIIDGVRSLLNVLRGLARMVRAVMRGDFAGAFDIAKESIGETSLAFLPFYLIAAKVLGGIASFIFAILSPLRLLRGGFFGLGWVIGKAVKWATYFIPFKRILGFLAKKGLPWVASAFWAMSKAMISGIWAISKAMWAAMVSNPILLAIALIIGAIALIIYYWDDIKAAALEAWDFISKKAQEIIDDIGKWFTDMAESFGKKWDSIVESFKAIWDDAIKTVKNWFLGMIPDSVLNWFNDGDKQISASLNAASVNPVTPVFGNVGWGGLGVRPNNNISNSQNIQQTNHITVNGTGNPTAVANKIGAAVGSFNGKFSIGQMEYQG